MRDAPKRPEREGAGLKTALQKAMKLAGWRRGKAFVVIPADGGFGYDIKRFDGKTNQLVNTKHISLTESDVSERLKQKENPRDALVFRVIANPGQQGVLRLVDRDLIPSLRRAEDGVPSAIEVEY